MSQFKTTCLIIFFSGLLLLLKCAVQKAPSGGPEDKEAPIVIKTFPEPNSLNITNLPHIVFIFNEAVKKETIKKSLRINPPLALAPKFKWKGNKQVRIIIDDSLKKNTTYSVTLGTEARDFHGNSLETPFVLAFSTDSILHTGKIKGRIFDKIKNDDIVLNLYDAIQLDSTDTAWYAISPILTSTSNQDGSFEMGYLNKGQYRLLAFIDKNFDKTFTSQVDDYGLFHKDIVLATSTDSVTNLLTRMISVDTTSARLQKIETVKRGEIKLTFSRPAVIKDIIIENKAGSKTPFLFNRTGDEAEEFILYFKHPDVEDTISIALNFDNQEEKKDFFYQLPKDTIAPPKLEYKIPEGIYVEDPFALQFSNPVDTGLLTRVMNLKLKNKIIPLTIDWNNFKTIRLSPGSTWEMEQEYQLDLDLSSLKDYWGNSFPDTLHQLIIPTIPEDDLGGLAGSFTEKWPGPEAVFNLTNIDNKRNFIRKVNVLDSPDKKFEFPLLPGGQYIIDGWFETNTDRVWNGGNLLPFAPSEPLFWSPDTFKVRVRWVKDGIVIDNK